MRDLGPHLALMHLKLGDDENKTFDIETFTEKGMRSNASNSVSGVEGIRDGVATCAALLEWERFAKIPPDFQAFEWFSDQLRSQNLACVEMLREEYIDNPQSPGGKLFSQLGSKP